MFVHVREALFTNSIKHVFIHKQIVSGGFIKEALFNNEIRSSLEAFGAWAYKIPDLPAFRGSMTRFAPPKPSDIVGIYDGIGFAIEGKQIKEFKAFGLSAFQDSQIEGLAKIIKAGGRAFAFLNIRIPRTENRLLIFDWEEWYPKWQEASIKKEALINMPFLPGAHGGFNLSSFLESLKRFKDVKPPF